MKMNLFLGTLSLTMLLLLATSCTKDIKNETAEERLTTSQNELVSKTDRSSAAQSDLLKDVRRVTARFHSTTQAIMAGYQPDNHCVYVPGMGGMGFHWVNPLIVDTQFDPLKPEVVLYAPGPNGKLKLVAVEYIVVDEGQDHPMFGDKLFDIGGTPFPMPHWSLHVWLYEENPLGMFRPFNPNISCN